MQLKGYTPSIEHKEYRYMVSKAKSLPRGTRVLTKKDFVQIKHLRKRGWSYGMLAVKFGVSRTTVFNYLTGKQVPYDC